ncbi:hypothetical protein U9R90_25015 [Streptomyces sp. E11-3]|uniref:hypothetical protein n=1 Tax=Streptomyces sp. E11-3 TaxID=3110112 RepID=UPI00397F7A15
MRTRATTALATSLLALALVGCSTETDDNSDNAKAKPSASQSSTAQSSDSSQLSVQRVAQKLSQGNSLGEQREATVEKSDHPNAEIGRIDTDRVIIYEMKTPKAATARAKTMSSVSDARPQHAAGRFVLSWRTDDVPSSDDFMNKVNRQLDSLAATEQ